MTPDFKTLDNEALLEKVADERLPNMKRKQGEPFREPDEQLIHSMVDELIARGVYPKETVEGNPNTVYSMVDGWGAHWHVWRGPFECPHCKADLRDQRTGPPFKREIGMVAHDRVTHYVCPDCKQTI